MRRICRLGISLSCLAASACGDSEPAKEHCLDQACPVIGDVSTSGDVVFHLDSADSLVSYALGDTFVNAKLKSGEFAIQIGDMDCMASEAHVCSATINHFQLEFDSVSFPVARGNLDNVVFATDVPLPIRDGGDGYVIGSGTQVQACMSIDGRNDSYVGPLNSSIVLKTDLASGVATLEGNIPFQFHQSNEACEVVGGASVTFIAGASIR
ncbi:MAG TPA: hypothetical protein VIV60_25620 [Polyangiaceae bacterium]